MGYIEYHATLTSPHPKETIKAIEERRKAVALAKKRNGEDNESNADLKLFKSDHRNTTFYEALAAEGGEEALTNMKKLFGDNVEESRPVELYQPDATDVEFFQKALGEETVDPSSPINPMLDFDQIEF